MSSKMIQNTVGFRYKAVDRNGKAVTGEHRSHDRHSLLTYLRTQGLTALRIEPLGEMQQAPETNKMEAAPETRKMSSGAKVGKSAARAEFTLPTLQSVTRKEITVFTRQLSTTLNAGLPLLRIIHVLHRECTNAKLKKILESLGQSLQRGKRFSDALAEHPRVFDEMYLNMIRVGESGGSLPECVARLATLLEKEQTLRRKIKAATAYPLFILIFTSIMTYALVALMMPMFIPMFRESGLNIERDYPLTHFLMNASEFATDPVSMGMALLSLFGLGLGFHLFSRTEHGNYAIDHCKFNLPFFAGFIQKVVAARFSRSFSLLLKSGVPLINALQLVAGAAGNRMVASRIRRVGRNIQEGDAISKTIREAGLFPDLLIQMATMGEEAGSLPDMLERVADYYDEEVETSVAAMTALLEPAMMVLIGGVVGVFVMGVLLPILGISAGMQGQL